MIGSESRVGITECREEFIARPEVEDERPQLERSEVGDLCPRCQRDLV